MATSDDQSDRASAAPLAEHLTPAIEAGVAKPLQGLPFASALGIEAHQIGGGEALLSIPYRDDLVGDPETGVIHGGVVTALLDTCAGVAAMSSPTAPRSVATLDLRIDYMRPAAPGARLLAHAACYRETKSITFVRAVAYHSEPSQPVATAIGAFMVDGRSKSTSKERDGGGGAS